MAENVVKLEPRLKEAPRLEWELTLNRKTRGLELVMLNADGNCTATVTWRLTSITPGGFNLVAAWEERLCGEPPAAAS